jgi:hypothetical protein
MEASDDRYLRSLIAQGEHQQLDFKFEISDARKIARTFSAFSNTDGGRLLVGVKDNGRITGIRSDEEYYMVEAAASLYCKPEARFDTRNLKTEGKSVLEVYIPPVKQKPLYARDEKNRWMAYVRVADENILAHIVQLRIWNEEPLSRGRLLKFTRKEQILLATLENRPGRSLSEIKKDTGFKRNELVPLMTKLVLFDVVEMTHGGGNTGFSLKEKPGE